MSSAIRFAKQAKENRGDIVLGHDDGVAVVPLERRAEILDLCLAKIDQENATNADTKSGILPAAGFNLTIEEIG